ncbi:MAG: glycosyltransferase family 2 protein [Candidatus Undinarchaeales archaeon]|jgi:glycosyltransferase involved in cell wall biosynthesis|nr:glycosyltransferase family 2 protein [Candidatus Undinarchaeales archaeon]
MDISVVIPVYNEEENVQQLYDELTEVLKKLTSKYEILLVDDGSTDTTPRVIKELVRKDSHIVNIKLRKNFGQTPAMLAGFNHSTGKIILTLDADLQNDPADIPRMLAKLNKGFDVVCGWRMHREDNFLKKIPSKISNYLNRKFTGVPIHDSGCTLRAYKREAIEDIRLYGETHRYIPALIAGKGYKITEVVSNHRPRRFGKSKYGAGRLVKGLLDLLTLKFLLKYRSRPIHILGTIGFLTLMLGFASGLYLVVDKFYYGKSISNRPLLSLTVLLGIMGMQLFFTGFLAEMLVRSGYDPKRTYNIEEITKKKK